MRESIVGLFTFISFGAMAAIPANQALVDQYISFALRSDQKTIEGAPSKVRCTYAVVHTNLKLVGNGKTSQDAVTRLQLSCIKSQCQKLGAIAQEGVDQVNGMSDDEYRDFLEFSGVSPQEIERILPHRQPLKSVRDMTCETASPSYRMLAFDSCFATPVECTEK